MVRVVGTIASMVRVVRIIFAGIWYYLLDYLLHYLLHYLPDSNQAVPEQAREEILRRRPKQGHNQHQYTEMYHNMHTC